jgi:hypothetical protein
LESNAQAQFGQSAGEYLQTYYGITQSEYSKIIQSLFLSNSVTSGLMDATEVSDEQSREYYDSHVGDFEEATVRRILFSFEGTEENARAQEESQALANETLERVNAGEDMTGLALDLSEEPGVTENSGEYSFYRDGMSVSGQLEQGFVDWAFEDGRQVGDAGVVELSGGYYVLKLENKTTDSFEDRHDSIVQSIKEEQYRATVDEWVADPQYAVTLSDKVYEGIS